MCFVKYFLKELPYSKEKMKYIAPRPETAKEDIICYKIFKRSTFKHVISPYLEYKYEYNKLNKEINIKPYSVTSISIIINEGYHSYMSEKECKCKIEEIEDTVSTRMCKCIIPKGSKYYSNEYDEYVSSNIIVLDKRNWWQRVKDLVSSLL